MGRAARAVRSRLENEVRRLVSRARHRSVLITGSLTDTAPASNSLVTYNLFNAASCFTKLSILATFYRLLGPSRRRMKMFVRVFAGAIAFQSALFCIMLFLQCR